MRALLPALLLLGACAPDRDDVAPADPHDVAGRALEEAVREAGPLDVELDGMAISADLDGEPVEAVTTEDGGMEIGLTDRVLYSRLSPEARAEIAADMKESARGQEGLGGRIARSVTQAVAEGLGTAVQVPLADVRDVRVEGGRLVIEMADGEPSPFERAQTDGRPLLDQVPTADAERLAAAFRQTAGR